MRNAIRLLVEVARAEAPDAPYRPARYCPAFEIGFIGAAALDGPTVRAGLRRLAQNMPLHCTHELFTVDTAGPTITIRDGWTMKPGDAETLHYVQQYVAALLDMICGVATLLSGMLPSMKPSVDAIAASAGMSDRTF